MSPILGIIASQNYPRVTNSYESIATVTVGSGGASNVEFTSIPSTYTHLQIRMIGRSSAPAWAKIGFNSDTTAGNYYSHELYGTGSVAGAAAYSGESTGAKLFTTYAHTSVFTGSVIDILDYTNTNKAKTVRCLTGWDNNGSGEIRLSSGLYTQTSAISSLKITSDSTFQQYTQFALYGIKGS